MKKLIIFILVLMLSFYAFGANLTIDTTTITTFGSAHDWENTVYKTAVVAVANTTQILVGDESVKMTTNSADAAILRSTNGMGVTGTLMNDAVVWVYVADAAALSNLNIIRLKFYESPLPDYVEHLVYSATNTRQEIVPGVWSPLRMWPGVATEQNSTWKGSASGLAFTQCEIQIQRTGGVDVAVSFGLLTTDNASKGGFVWNFDDSRDGVFTFAYPVLRANGWQGVVAVITDNIGAEGYMTEAQLQILYDNGWDLVSHTASHPGMSGLTVAQIVDELSSSSAYLISKGWYRGARMLVWPGNTAVQGSDNWHGIQQARPFYDIIRGRASTSPVLDVEMQTLINTSSPWNPISWEQLPYMTLDVGTDDTFADDYETAFQAIIDRGGVINSYTHQVGVGLTGIDMDLPLLNDTAAWLKAQENLGKVEVVTYGQWREAVLESRRTDDRTVFQPRYRPRYAGPVFKDID